MAIGRACALMEPRESTQSLVIMHENWYVASGCRNSVSIRRLFATHIALTGRSQIVFCYHEL